ncbi:N-alpha-acetyltransferase 25, NatB auxiliary subunit [Podospora conica]|nr:N-alpha-acetyltransferase 25, NatB auxiliary subunit [Schizothecium conicum]
MSFNNYGRPPLRSTVDVQLQTAFSDGNWNAVIRLADKRAKSLKDPYYDAIKICAESQLDGAAEKCSVLTAIDELVRQKTVPDIDTLELYEWAAWDFIGGEIEYADTLGPLRVRWAKANPKSPVAIQCLRSCLEYWDLVSAQQISTALDRAYVNSGDRRHMFWSITLTFLLSISPQCSESSRKVYSLLVLKQLERAAEVTENATKTDVKDRGLQTEEEVCLYYRVLLANGSKADFIKRVQCPKLGALALLEKGHKLLFWESLKSLETWGEWDLIYDLCRRALRMGVDGVTTPFFVCDWLVWKRFITAAGKSATPESALEEVQAILKQYFAIDTKTAAMYKKNLSLALLETTFQLAGGSQTSDDGPKGMTPRVIQIGLFLQKYFDKLSAFEDVKGYVADLSFEEAKTLMEEVLPNLLDGKSDKPKQFTLKAFVSKLRYLLTTCPQTLSRHPSVVDGKEQSDPYQCRFCSQLTSLPCRHCLKDIVTEAASTYKQISNDKQLIAAIPSLDKDPRLDLAMVIGTAILKLAGLRTKDHSLTRLPMRGVDAGLLLQATLVLDTQLKETPRENGLRLLLVQLHLLLGSASIAYQLWIPMDVKRTIQDALSPLFFDRISTLSPGLFHGSRPLMEPLRVYYRHTLRDECPLKIWDAFQSGSYTSILGMNEYDSTLRRSCTLMMSMVEESRATRAFGGKVDVEIADQQLAWKITDDTTLVHQTDYGSFTNLESHHGPPIQDFVRLGPGLSNERSHLSFLAEQLHDLLGHKPPKDYKPSKAHESALRDRTYTLERLTQLHNSLTTFLHAPATPSLLTGPETTYFSVLSLLASALATSLSTARGDPSPKGLAPATQAVRAALAALRAEFNHAVATQASPCLAMADMHTLSCLRDTALAARHAAGFVLALHEREVARDRSGKSALHRDVVGEMKALEATAGKVLAEARAHVQRTKETLGEGGWLDRLLEVMFPGGGEGEVERAVLGVVGEDRAEAEDWAGRVLESWREGVKGWVGVRWE